MTDTFNIIRSANTAVPKLGLNTENIIARLQNWQTFSEFNILAADAHSVTLQFTRLPDDFNVFTQDLCEFCSGFNDLLDEDNIEELLDAGLIDHETYLALTENIEEAEYDYAIEIFRRGLIKNPQLTLSWNN